MISEADMQVYLKGKKLFGDDFDLDAINQWYEAEKEGYSSLVREETKDYEYAYHKLNEFHGFSKIDLPKNSSALGIGSAFGSEFLPVIDRLGSIDILDPSDDFDNNNVLRDHNVRYSKPRADGLMDFSDNSFDLITAFGVLHHIPNVSTVLGECYRTLRPGGYMLTREPIVSQGDWRQPRGALTRHERGIPAAIFEKSLKDLNFEIISSHFFDFTPFVKFMNIAKFGVYNNAAFLRVDHVLASIFAFNKKYHRTGIVDRFGPASVYYALRKPRQS